MPAPSAAGSRLLWPVLLIAVYYAAGVLLTGTSPMVSLLTEPGQPRERVPAGPAAGVQPPPIAVVPSNRPTAVAVANRPSPQAVGARTRRAKRVVRHGA